MLLSFPRSIRAIAQTKRSSKKKVEPSHDSSRRWLIPHPETVELVITRRALERLAHKQRRAAAAAAAPKRTDEESNDKQRAKVAH